MQTLVLCYHSQNILGGDYSNNDHVALASDLQAIARRRLPVISLKRLVDFLQGRWGRYPKAAVVLTCDDGTLLDWHDYQHPEHGFQRSFDGIVQEFLAGLPYRQSAKGIMTSFVIADPVARNEIDQVCYGGAPLSGEDWWQQAAASKRWLFGNHSWNHMHVGLTCLADEDGEPGNFHGIRSSASARRQVVQADLYLRERLPGKALAGVFAYPYGHSNCFLAHEFLPDRQQGHDIRAAVTTTAGLVRRDTNRFLIPRFTCGEHWQTPEQFEEILDRLESVRQL